MTVDEAEVELRDEAAKRLSRWRRPLPCAYSRSSCRGDAESTGLREALYDLTGPVPMTYVELASELREQWGGASNIEIAAQLSALLRNGDVERLDGGYVRVEKEDG